MYGRDLNPVLLLNILFIIQIVYVPLCFRPDLKHCLFITMLTFYFNKILLEMKFTHLLGKQKSGYFLIYIFYKYRPIKSKDGKFSHKLLILVNCSLKYVLEK